MSPTHKPSSRDDDQQPALPGFELVSPFVDHTDDGKSNTIELFDALVTYSHEHARSGSENPFIEVEKRFRNRTFKVRIAPAVIKKGGRASLILPSRRESLVEKALRKLAVEDQDSLSVRTAANGDPEVWVRFTMHQLRSVLTEQGHGFKVSELAEALSVLAKTEMTISGETPELEGAVEGGGIIDRFIWRRRKAGDDEGHDYSVSVKLHPLITRSLLQRTFRRIDFAKLMRPKSELARWLYSRLSHNYTQAAHDDLMQCAVFGNKGAGYSLSLSTILRETGMRFTDARLAARAVRIALGSMRQHDILRSTNWHAEDFPGYIEEITYAPTKGRGRPAILDILWHIFPSDAVVDDIIAANKTNRAMNARFGAAPTHRGRLHAKSDL